MKKDVTKWHKWFAWYPVDAYRRGEVCMVWFNYVYRKSDDYCTQYRSMADETALKMELLYDEERANISGYPDTHERKKTTLLQAFLAVIPCWLLPLIGALATQIK